MASGNSVATQIAAEAGFDMPSGQMAAPPGPSVDMPSGEMPGEEVSAFTPATGEMPQGEMGEPTGGVLAGLAAGIEAAALSDMPGGYMGGIEAAATQAPAIEISGSWTLLLTSSIFTNEGSR
jgi:hypothetical protein